MRILGIVPIDDDAVPPSSPSDGVFFDLLRVRFLVYRLQKLLLEFSCRFATDSPKKNHWEATATSTSRSDWDSRAMLKTGGRCFALCTCTARYTMSHDSSVELLMLLLPWCYAPPSCAHALIQENVGQQGRKNDGMCSSPVFLAFIYFSFSCGFANLPMSYRIFLIPPPRWSKSNFS